MREISAEQITQVVKKLCVEANCYLSEDMKTCIAQNCAAEPWAPGREILERIVENYTVAAERHQPICQDTGVACVFLTIGQDVHVNGSIADAVNEGVRQGYTEGYLRKSVVRDPLDRVNTGDNTPGFLTVHLVPGDGCRITVMPKGFGSENMSRIAMLKPADGVEGVHESWCLWDGKLLDDDIVAAIRAFAPGVRIVMVNDQCHSGGIFAGTDRALRFSGILRGEFGDVRSPSLIQFAACRAEESSIGYPIGGTWTTALMKVLAVDRRISWREWFDRAKAHPSLDGRQQPQWNEMGPVSGTFRDGPVFV